MTHALTATLAAALILVTAGCGVEPTDPRPSADERPVADLAFKEHLGEADCHMFTPVEAASKSRVVLTGTVAGVVPGPASFEPYEFPNRRARTNFMVFKIDVDKVVKGAEHLGPNAQHAFVAMGRGFNLVKPDGKVDGFDGNPSVDDVRAAIPVGTRVVAFTGPFDWNPRRVTNFEGKDEGRPAGSHLLGSYGLCGAGLTFDEGPKDVEYFGMPFNQLASTVDKLP